MQKRAVCSAPKWDMLCNKLEMSFWFDSILYRYSRIQSSLRKSNNICNRQFSSISSSYIHNYVFYTSNTYLEETFILQKIWVITVSLYYIKHEYHFLTHSSQFFVKISTVHSFLLEYRRSIKKFCKHRFYFHDPDTYI